MKKALLSIIVIPLLFSCNKTDNNNNPPGNNNSNNNGCGDGYVCFNIDGTEISKQGGGYELSDTNLFVKYEEGTTQLSIDIFGKNTGNYTVTDKRKTGNGRIYYFKKVGGNDVQYMAETGLLNISAYDATTRKISGTFSGTLYNYNGTTETFIKTDSVVIKDGKFNNVALQKI